MAKKFRRTKQAALKEKAGWKLIDDLHNASIHLGAEDSYAAKCMVAWHRENGYLSQKQQSFAANLIAKVVVRKALNVKKKHWLYAISDGVNIKLGFSANPQNRVRELQTGHPSKLKVLWRLECGETRGLAVRAERKLHRLCKEHRRQGEWFASSCMPLVEGFQLRSSERDRVENEAAELRLAAAARLRI